MDFLVGDFFHNSYETTAEPMSWMVLVELKHAHFAFSVSVKYAIMMHDRSPPTSGDNGH
jgi:hypothetical protein